jgi:hypothetical protein
MQMGPIEIKTVWIQTRKHRLVASCEREAWFGSAFEKVQLGRGASGGREREKEEGIAAAASAAVCYSDEAPASSGATQRCGMTLALFLSLSLLPWQAGVVSGLPRSSAPISHVGLLIAPPPLPPPLTKLLLLSVRPHTAPRAETNREDRTRLHADARTLPAP